MKPADAPFAALRQSADAGAAAMIERLVNEAPDRALGRINVLDFAKENGLDEEHAIAAFLHAARLGLFELSWNVLCPGCSGVLDASATLKTMNREHYSCALCAAGYEPTLDEMVELTFTVNPQVRRIAAHHPDSLSIWEYYRQIFWSSGIELPDGPFDRLVEGIVIASTELQAHDRTKLVLELKSSFAIVFDPVTHTAHFLDVKGEPTEEPQEVSVVCERTEVPTATTVLRPGPVHLSLENTTNGRVLPTVWNAGDELHHLLGRRKPFLTAKRLLTNQTFREIYRTDTLDVDQRLKITSLTFLFTDLKGSTALYERVGDLVAYDLVKAHFHVLSEIIAAETGAVVKTIGDAVMATFPTPDRALAAALRMREAMRELNERRKHVDLLVKIGIHEGPCLAVMFNDRQDYFGQTVNIASRVQNLAQSRSILATGSIVEHAKASKLLEKSGLVPVQKRAALRGVTEELTVYEIP